MKRLLTLAFAVTALHGLSGCYLLINKVMSASAYKDALATAPEIENPATTGTITDVTVTGNDQVAYKLSSYTPQELCIDAATDDSPAQVQSFGYELSALKDAEQDRDKVAKLRSANVKVLRSSSQLVPVRRTVTDTIRDGSGRVIATQERQVQELETRWDTDVRICFANPTTITADIHFLVLEPMHLNAASTWSGNTYFAVWRVN